MKFRDAVNSCKVRGAIYRLNGYDSITPKGFKFAKNHNAPLECRVAWDDQIADDWIVQDSETDYNPLLG